MVSLSEIRSKNMRDFYSLHHQGEHIVFVFDTHHIISIQSSSSSCSWLADSVPSCRFTNLFTWQKKIFCPYNRSNRTRTKCADQNKIDERSGREVKSNRNNQRRNVRAESRLHVFSNIPDFPLFSSDINRLCPVKRVTVPAIVNGDYYHIQKGAKYVFFFVSE